jgi:hypothetical protein
MRTPARRTRLNRQFLYGDAEPGGRFFCRGRAGDDAQRRSAGIAGGCRGKKGKGPWGPILSAIIP